ncbi:MAG: hypothetical protein NTV34_15695 [Proteobacteria bacterium]|nr:hypothetical protein [Pseudomonadota bacterium]
MATWKHQSFLIRFLIASGFTLLLPVSVASAAKKAGGNPSSPAYVRHVGENERGPYVVIDQGSKSGFVIGLDLCLFDDLGQETGCGVIERTNLTAAGIRLPIGKRNFTAEGNRAWSVTWGPLPVAEGTYAVDDSTDVDKLVSEEELEPEDPSMLQRRVSYQYVAAFLLPVTSNNLQFDAASRASGQGTVWGSGSILKKSLVGLAVNLRLPKPGFWDQGIILGYNFMQATPLKTDYDLTDSSKSVESSVSAHFYRVGWSRGYGIFSSDHFKWMASAGLDGWLVMHRFRADSSDGSSLAAGAIYNGLLTAPLSTWTECDVGGWTWTTGVDIQVPVFMRGGRVSGQVGYNEQTTADKDISAIGRAINPRKSLGVAFKLGIGAKI